MHAQQLRDPIGALLSDDALYDLCAFVVESGREAFDKAVEQPGTVRTDVDTDECVFFGIPGMVYWERFEEEIALPD